MDYKYHLDSALVKPTPDRWLKLQDLILKNKVKDCFDFKMVDVPTWVVGGWPSHEIFSVVSRRKLEISVAGHPPSLFRDHFSSPRVVAKSCQRDEGIRPLF